jgi:hypothetical protein
VFNTPFEIPKKINYSHPQLSLPTGVGWLDVIVPALGADFARTSVPGRPLCPASRCFSSLFS